jgi:hypothetical protein
MTADVASAQVLMVAFVVAFFVLGVALSRGRR